jgi:hypothetical protein
MKQERPHIGSLHLKLEWLRHIKLGTIERELRDLLDALLCLERITDTEKNFHVGDVGL